MHLAYTLFLLYLSIIGQPLMSMYGVSELWWEEDGAESTKDADRLCRACVDGNLAEVKIVRNSRGITYLDTLHWYKTRAARPIILASEYKQWNIVKYLLDEVKGINASSYMGHLVLEDDALSSEKKITLLNSFVKQGMNINDVGECHPFWSYVKHCSKKIDYNDPILLWFIKKKVTFAGNIFEEDDGKDYFHNTIFFTIVKDSNATREDAFRISKALMYHTLEPMIPVLRQMLLSFNRIQSSLYAHAHEKKQSHSIYKIPKPIMAIIGNHVLKNDKNVEEIATALAQISVGLKNRVILIGKQDLLIQDLQEQLALAKAFARITNLHTNCQFLLEHESEISLFDPEKWNTIPISQLKLCAPPAKK
jgi:hypothetical protein